MLVTAKKNLAISQSDDARQAIWKAVGDISKIHIALNRVLVGIYIRPEKTSGGIIRPSKNVDEDEYQGKVGLVLKLGSNCFDHEYFSGFHAKVDEWVVFRVGDTWPVLINGTSCRFIRDEALVCTIPDPEVIF